jgi:hypothetical protein
MKLEVRYINAISCCFRSGNKLREGVTGGGWREGCSTLWEVDESIAN